MKHCKKCDQTKAFSEFNRDRQRPTGYQRYCRLCDNAMRREWYQKSNHRQQSIDKNRARRADNRAWYNALKLTMACMKCGENHPAALDLHHRDPALKDRGVSDLMGWSRQRILKELAKCDILCASCHRKLHWEERNGPFSSTVEHSPVTGKVAGSAPAMVANSGYGSMADR